MAIDVGDAKITLGLDTKGFESKLGGIQDKMAKMGKAVTALGAIGAAGFAMIIKAAIDFEGKMREVNTMLGLSQDEFQALSDQVKDVSKSVGKDAGEMAESLYQIVSAGYSGAEALDLLEVSAKAAVGGVTDVATAADGLTSVLNAFKKPASEAERVADIMFATVKGGKTTFEELSASMFNVAPIAAAAGIEFEEVAAALATMTKQGVPTSVATTQLRAAIQALIKPTADMSAKMVELGITSGVALIQEQGLKGALDLLYDSVGGDIEQLGKMVGSVEGLSAVLSLTGDNAEIFATDIENAMNSAGISTEAYNEINEGAGRKFEMLMENVKTLAIDLGETLLPAVTKIMESVTGVIEKVGEWIDQHPGLTDALLKLGLTITALAIVGGPIMMMNKAILGIILALKSMVLYIFTTAIPALIKLASGFIVALAAAGPVGWAAIAGMAGIAAGGIYALTQLLGGAGAAVDFVDTEEAAKRAEYEARKEEYEARKEEFEARPGFQYGGIVPGAIGTPMTAIVHSGETIVPAGAGMKSVLNINVGTLIGDDMSLRNFARIIKDKLGQDNRRNTFGQVNRGYYYGRSSL